MHAGWRTGSGLLLLTLLPSITFAELLPPDRPIPEVVDHYIDTRLDAENVTPAPPVDDAEFVRRLMLDLVGRIPAAVEVRSYVDSADPDKRVKLVDRLLQSEEFVEHQAESFDQFITGGKGSILNYLKVAIADNRPWDQMFREIILVDQEDEQRKEAANFLKQRVRETDELTNDVSVAFFGINVSCAKCHDHPLAYDWTQDHFYGMKSFFNRTFDNKGFLGEYEFGGVEFEDVLGEKKQARLMFLTGTIIEEPQVEEPSKEEMQELRKKFEELAKKKQAPPAPKFSRREALVTVALDLPERHFFARNIANRLWHQYIGYGLVMPLDQMHSQNPASHPELLEWLARDVVEHNYDLRRIIRGLVLSQTYARRSRWHLDERPDADLFAVGPVRPLTPEQFARSLQLATQDPDRLQGDVNDSDLQKRIRGAAQPRDANLFERPHEKFQVSANEGLLFSNGDKIERLTQGGLVNSLARMDDDRELILTAGWNILSRPLENQEIKLLQDYLSARPDHRKEAIVQVVWALISSSEFRFNY